MTSWRDHVRLGRCIVAGVVSGVHRQYPARLQLLEPLALRRAHDELEMRVQHRTADLKTANARLHAAIAERRRLEDELLEITEKERRRIGLDLHDDLGQQLAGLALMTKGLELKLAKRRARETADAAKVHRSEE